MSPDQTNPPVAQGKFARGRGLVCLLALLFIAGTALRLYAPPAFQTRGHDEFLYMRFVQELNTATIFQYPEIVQLYVQNSEALEETKLPPTRFLYIFFGSCWDELFYRPPHDNSLEAQAYAMLSLHAISCLFSILTMPLAAFFAFRLGGARMAVGVLALVAFSPMQIYVSRHALIDGFFAFWALLSLWFFWECLQRPGNYRWLAAFIVSLALLVLVKENAFFVFVALVGILIVNRWAKLGVVNRALVLGTFGGALLGVGCMALLSGGLDYDIQTYMLLVRTASHLEYAIRTGDGPWFRYICELLLMNPLVLLLAIGAIFRLGRGDKAPLYLFCFVAFSYLVMCNVRYGMNLRYTHMWDMPLSYLAFWELGLLCKKAGRHQTAVLSCCVAVMCVFALRQYKLFFVDNKIYEPVPIDLLHAVKIYVP